MNKQMSKRRCKKGASQWGAALAIEVAVGAEVEEFVILPSIATDSPLNEYDHCATECLHLLICLVVWPKLRNHREN